MTTHTRSELRDEPGVRFGVASGALVLAFSVCASAGLSAGQTELVALCVGGLASAGLPMAMTTGIGVAAWALFTGFVEHDYGELTFAREDLTRLAVFTATTLALAIATHRTFKSQGERP